MDLLSSFQHQWQQQFHGLLPENVKLLLAVSGGVDSVVLLDLLAKSGFDVVIAHCNFQLRGEESGRDELFVHAAAKKYEKEVIVNRFDTQQYAADQKISIQEAARVLRYRWFAEVIGSWPHNKARKYFIVTAHHADDNIETVLMHLFRGTGIHGLTGIAPLQQERALIRPLLPFRKEQLVDHARTQQLAYVTDSSNHSDKYTRNFFRNHLIPGVKNVFPQAEENVLETILRVNEAALLYREAVQVQLDKLINRKADEIHVPVLKWKRLQPLKTLTWELLKPFGFTSQQTEEAIKLLDAANGFLTSATHRLIRNRNWMIIAPLAAETSAHRIIGREDRTVLFAGGELVFLKEKKITHEQLLKEKHSLPVTEAMISADAVSFPLLLRQWKEGDYFYPLGMQKKKKLNRFFIDQKLSRTEKEKIWVLEMDKKIIWVIGHRIDDRFRITPATQQVLHIGFTPAVYR